MSVKISGEYLGDKQCRLLHEPSGAILVTDAPKDNSGKGREFSPTDLAGASMASCMMTIMAILAEREQVDLTGSSFSVVKHMQESPRRIAKLEVTFHLPQHCEETFRLKLENAARACPVHRSFHPDVEIPVEFIYDV